MKLQLKRWVMKQVHVTSTMSNFLNSNKLSLLFIAGAN